MMISFRFEMYGMVVVKGRQIKEFSYCEPSTFSLFDIYSINIE